MDNLKNRYHNAIRIFKNEGLHYILWLSFKELNRLIMNSIDYYYFRIFQSKKTFTIQDKKYEYFIHRYNGTWKCERAVEIPIIWEILNKYSGKNILEVGNVLSHYFHIEHDVLDKYEKGKDIINEDVIDYSPAKKYDLIVSISTLEHVVYDENPKDDLKILKAINNLKRMLNPNGQIIVTLPISFNQNMDRLVEEGKIIFNKSYFLKRTSEYTWKETNQKEVFESKFNYPYKLGNGLIIGFIYNN